MCAFIHTFVENKLTADTETETELQCSEICPCRTLQNRARADRYRDITVIIMMITSLLTCHCLIMVRYIFSLASNPFYLWLICTIFYEVGEIFKLH